MIAIRKLTAPEKETLVQRVLDVHQSDPVRLRKSLPEVADLLDKLDAPAPARWGNSGLTGLTERERNFHKEALEDILRRFKSLTPAEAVRGLEHGANLLADGFTPGYPSRQELLRLVRKATGIQPRKEGKPLEKVVGQGNPSRVVSVVKGIDLHLTWEFKLVKVTMDPHQWHLRGKALSITGIGKGAPADLAERHDDYLAGASLDA